MFNTHYIWKDETGFPVAAVSLNVILRVAKYGVHRLVDKVEEFIHDLVSQANRPEKITRSESGFIFWELDLSYNIAPDVDVVTRPFVDLLGFDPVTVTATAFDNLLPGMRIKVTQSHKVAGGMKGRIDGSILFEILPNRQRIPTVGVTIDSRTYNLRADEFELL